MSFWATRKRRAADIVIAPGVAYVGGPGQGDDLSNEVRPVGYYTFHQGDLFTPGTQNWALDMSHDTPLYPIWGRGVMRNPWAFSPVQPPQVYALQAPPIDALRGIMVQGIRAEKLEPLYGENFSG